MAYYQLFLLWLDFQLCDIMTIIGSLLVLEIILCYSTAKAAAVYNYDENSEELFLGFRNIINKDLVLGGLFPIYADCTGVRQNVDVRWVEAMLFAVDRINSDMNLLPNLTIGFDIRDTCNDESYGIYSALNLALEYDSSAGYSSGYSDNPLLLGIVGPANTSVIHPVATLLGVEIFQLQLPLVSYASSDAALSNKDLYKYFLRTIPSDNLQAYAVADLISYFEWNYVNVIVNDDVCGDSGYDAFVNGATERGICIENKIEIPGSGVGVDRTLRIKEAVETLHNSKASVVIVFTNEDTVMELFEELN